MMEQLLKDEDDDKSIWDSISRYCMTVRFHIEILYDCEIGISLQGIVGLFGIPKKVL